MKYNQYENMDKAILSEARKLANEKTFKCFMTDCNEPAINSHSQSNSSSLKNISVNGEVIKLDHDPFTASILSEEPLELDFKKVGINRASTFKGFCKKHDSEYFKSVDSLDSTNLRKEVLCKLAFRTFAMEVRRKEWACNICSIAIRKYIGISSTQPFEAGIYWAKLFLNSDFPFYLKKFEVMFSQDIYTDIESAVFIIDHNIGLSTSSLINPFAANSNLSSYYTELKPMPAMFLTVLPKEKETVTIFTYFLSIHT